jgi:hypothetical protein
VGPGRLGAVPNDVELVADRVTGDLDLAAIRRPGLEQRRVNVDFPQWMIESLDREARRLGVTRQSIIKVWIAERLEHGIGPA